MSKSITITVKLFAAYQEAYGKSELQLEFPDQTPIITVLNHIIAEHPELEQWRNQTRLGRNFQFVTAETPLNQDDEVVLIPPVSGG